MSEKNLKPKIAVIKKPIVKKLSSFVGGSAFNPKKIVNNNDAYKRK